ncbi:MAG: hypothetical protein HZC40_24290 [Chloroflexi bacterium]|nr:hypothetical protein [Chloroflexota bacterium]
MDSPPAVTKILRPGKRNTLLSRPRLVNFLHENIERKLLLVSAAAGYGKTSLLIDFAHETALPVCWYALDASDGDPKIFFEYLVAALRRQFPDFGARTRGLLENPATQRDAEVIVGTLVTEIYETIPTFFILVLDDFHLIEESEPVNQIVDTLLRLLPENAHLIIASRTLPAKLTLTRLVARQEVAGLGVNDLRFTAEEIRALVLQNFQTALTEPHARELAEHSEGWITGILLTTHSLWRGLFRDLVRLQGQPTNVFNYLMDEVFAQQPPALQKFLLESATLDQLSPALCAELLETRDAAEMLIALEQKNLFITRLDEEETWYRYHHLFQEFLWARLRETDADRWRALHQRAAAMFRARNAPDQVIAHLLRANLFDQAAPAIEQIAQATFAAGRWTTLAKWIDALPRQVVEQYPGLLISRGMIWADTGHSDHALQMFSSALMIYERAGDRGGAGRTLIKQAACRRSQGAYHEAIAMLELALPMLGDAARRDIADARRMIGISYGMLGEWDKCARELSSALELFTALDDDAAIALVHQDLGVAYRTLGNPNAPQHFARALDFWRRADNPLGLANTLNSIGVSQHRRGQSAQAIETLNEARAHAHRSGQLRVEALVLASLGDVYRDQADYAAAQDAYQTAFDTARQINEGFLITYGLNALGETFRLTGDLDMAERLIHQAIEQAESHRSSYELGLTITALGILCNAQSNPETATEHLTRAVELLERGGAQRDSARAHLHLAHARWLQREYREAGAHLKTAVDIGVRLSEDQFIVGDSKQLAPLIEYARAKKIGDGYWARALNQAHALPLAVAEPRAAPAKPRVSVRGFGTGQISIDDKPVTKSDWESAATKELFFFLLAHPEGQRKDQLLEELWGALPAAKANGVFHSTAWRLRRALLPDCLIYADGVYCINDAVELDFDIAHFEAAVRQAERAANDAERADAYRRALALYQGDYLEDCGSAWCVPIRSALAKNYLNTLLALADLVAQQQAFAEAITLYQRILAQDNYREDVYRALMHAQVRAGDRSGALATYQQCAQILQSELYLAPSAETQILFERILADDPALAH